MTNKNLIERLRYIAAEAGRLDDEMPEGVNFAPCLDDDDISSVSEAAALIEQQEALLADMRTALVAALEMANIMEGLTSCRGDDDYVWGVQGKIEATLLAAKTHLGG